MRETTPEASTDALMARIAQLEAERARSEALVAQLSRDNEILRASQERLRQDLELLRRRIYIAKAERIDSRQLELEFAAKLAELDALSPPSPAEPPDGAASPDTTASSAPAGSAGDRKGKTKPKGRRDLRGLNVPEVRVEIPDALFEELVASGRAVRVGFEESYKLAWQRGGQRKVVIARVTYRLYDDDGEATFSTAEVPPQVLPRSLAAPSMLAHIVYEKFGKGLPLFRLESDFRRDGVPIDRGTMSRWIEELGGAVGATIVEAARREALATAFCINTDATGIAIQPERAPDGHRQPCRRGHFFVQIADRDHVFFEYTPKETSAAVADMFRGFKGYVQADAKSVFDILYRPAPDPAADDDPADRDRIEVGCWAHARRKFWEAAIATKSSAAREALYRIGRIYDLEARWRERTPEEIAYERNARSRPELKAFFKWAALEFDKVRNQRGLLRTAFGYALRQEKALLRFLDDGRLKPDNNSSERELRQIATGRKAWLFVGSDDHAASTASLLSLIASARLHGLDAESYLREVFRLLPHWPADRFLELAPKYWASTRARLDPRALGAELGDIAIPEPRPAPAEQQAPH